jgi:hypothetical protein
MLLTLLHLSANTGFQQPNQTQAGVAPAQGMQAHVISAVSDWQIIQEDPRVAALVAAAVHAHTRCKVMLCWLCVAAHQAVYTVFCKGHIKQ